MTRMHIGKVEDMPVNTIRQIAIEGWGVIALYHLPDGFFATEDRCSHGDATLSEGEIDGDEIVCPFHLGRFDIRSGEPTAAPCVTAIKRYTVEAGADGALYLDLE